MNMNSTCSSQISWSHDYIRSACGGAGGSSTVTRLSPGVSAGGGGGGAGGGAYGSDTFVWTVPPGVSSVTIRTSGGGGGAGGSHADVAAIRRDETRPAGIYAGLDITKEIR